MYQFQVHYTLTGLNLHENVVLAACQSPSWPQSCGIISALQPGLCSGLENPSLLLSSGSTAAHEYAPAAKLPLQWYPALLSSLKVCDPQNVQLSTRGNWLSLNIRLGKPSYCWVALYLNYLLSNASSVMSETANGSLLKFHISPLKCHQLEKLSEDTDCWMWSCVMHHLLPSDKTLSLVK